MPFQIIRNDITKVPADVIVNTANPKPTYSGGTDTAVYTAAGAEKLLRERKKIGDIAPGQAAFTPAFALPARYIIHTVGPVWQDGTHGEQDILRSCYRHSLSLAAALKADRVAFPLISTGTYGFPKEIALEIALSEIGSFLLTHEMTVLLVVFDRQSLELSRTRMREIEEYIDDHQVELAGSMEYGGALSGLSGRLPDRNGIPDALSQGSRRPRPILPSASYSPAPDSAPFFSPDELSALPPAEVRENSLEEAVSHPGDTFQQRLFQLIDESGMDDVTVYKKANIDRKLFSRIRSRVDYRPKKRTAVAFAIALRLDLTTMKDLLSRAEIAFSPSSTFDLIITYFVTHGIYDIFEINAALFRYGQPILGE